MSPPTPPLDSDRQACLFDTLPETEPRRRRGRRPAKTPTPEPIFPPTPIAPPIETPAPPHREATEPQHLDPATLSHPELSDLVAALSESSLGFLLVEVTQEVKRRLTPNPREPDTGEDEDAPPPQRRPHPQLVRALRTAMMELTENDIG